MGGGGGGLGTFVSGRLIIVCVPFLVTSRCAYNWERGGGGAGGT